MHTPHPDSHKHGLDDDCPRCQEAIANPNQLDENNLTRIWSGAIITRTDMAVFNTLYRRVVTVQRLCQAFEYEGFDPAFDNIMAWEKKPRPDAFSLFDHGGRA